MGDYRRPSYAARSNLPSFDRGCGYIRLSGIDHRTPAEFSRHSQGTPSKLAFVVSTMSRGCFPRSELSSLSSSGRNTEFLENSVPVRSWRGNGVRNGDKPGGSTDSQWPL